MEEQYGEDILTLPDLSRYLCPDAILARQKLSDMDICQSPPMLFLKQNRILPILFRGTIQGHIQRTEYGQLMSAV